MCQEKTTLINNVLLSLQEELSEEQLTSLRNSLTIELNNYEIHDKITDLAVVDNEADSLLQKFLATKRIEGKSEETIKRYKDVCYMMLHTIGKGIKEITTFDLRFYLAMYQETRHVSNRTLDGMRRCLASFFKFLAAERFIEYNPCLALGQIKYQKVIQKPYSDVEMERLKESCTTIRDLALIDFLYASGCRVSEVVHLNIEDVNFFELSATVLGKGNKERIIYLTPVAILHLQDYLKTRKDENPALFVSRKAPHNRLSKAGIETVLKELGKRAGIEKVHPHRYRRTLATNLLNRGANIQDVAVLLGHEDIKTTQIYCTVNQNNVQAAYRKFAS